MKNYLIYQAFVRFNNEEDLIVCKIQAINENEAKVNYFNEIHPNDPERVDFIDSYLSIREVSESEFNFISQDDIDNNRKIIGRWL